MQRIRAIGFDSRTRRIRARGILRGVTAVEIVVAVCSLLLCGTLLVEAVQQSREASRRKECETNLKQLGIAFHNYHDVYNTFPPGWVQPFRQADRTPGYGWPTSLLPYLNQGNLYNSIDRTISFHRMPEAPVPLLQTTLRVYRCPSDPTEVTNSLRGSFGTSNYSGNCGSDTPVAWAPSPVATFWPGGLDTNTSSNGLFWQNSFLRFRSIQDGGSYTFLAGERCLTSASGIWPGLRSNKNQSDLLTDCAFGNEPNSGITSFSSMHPGGANFLMCDGAIRFINNSINSTPGQGAEMGVYQKLANRADGQVIDGF